MLTQSQWVKRFGDPTTSKAARAKFENDWLVLWDIPDDINKAIPCLPNKLYINVLLIIHLEATLRDLIEAGLHLEIKTFDGCFNIRPKRGSSGLSVHTWAFAIDMNAAWNPFRGKVTWTKKFLDVWRKRGWVCGADWSKSSVDGMHFQGDNFIKL